MVEEVCVFGIVGRSLQRQCFVIVTGEAVEEEHAVTGN